MKDQEPNEMNGAPVMTLDPAVLMAQIVVLQQALAEKEKSDSLNILRIAAVEDRIGRKKSWIYAAVRSGTFPAPISLGGRAVGWIKADIDEWLHAQISAVRSRRQNPV